MSAVVGKKFHIAVEEGQDIRPDPTRVEMLEALVNHAKLGDKLEASFEPFVASIGNPELVCIDGIWRRSSADYALKMSCVTLDLPTDAISSLGGLPDASISITAFSKKIKQDWVVCPKPQAMQCLQILQKTDPKMKIEDLVITNPQHQGMAKYNPHLVDQISLTQVPYKGHILGLHTAEGDVQMHKVTFRIRACRIPTNILTIFKFFTDLAQLRPVSPQ